jgi:hypothetical protein
LENLPFYFQNFLIFVLLIFLTIALSSFGYFPKPISSLEHGIIGLQCGSQNPLRKYPKVVDYLILEVDTFPFLISSSFLSYLSLSFSSTFLIISSFLFLKNTALN